MIYKALIALSMLVFVSMGAVILVVRAYIRAADDR